MATLIQDDLKQLGMDVHVVPLEFRSLLDRVLRTHDYEACLLSLVEADADPNVDMMCAFERRNASVESPAEVARHRVGSRDRWLDAAPDGHAEIRRAQAIVRPRAELLMENLPLIPLVSPNILAGAQKGCRTFRPAVLEHYTRGISRSLLARARAGGVNERDPGSDWTNARLVEECLRGNERPGTS